MKLNLYHATTSAAADEIDRTHQFLPGRRGYAGGAIYFSAEQDSAFYHCRSSSIDVMIRCSVALGKCLDADKNTVNAQQCVSRGFDSVKIRDTDTYAVYDPSRISIQEFSCIGDIARWYPSMSKLKQASQAVAVLLAAVQASPAGCLKIHCMSQLYERHCDLRRTIDAEGGLKGFCKAHAELTWIGNSVSLGPKAALEIIIAAIQTSPNGFLNVSGDMAQLCSKHLGLRNAFGFGGLEAFCKAHDQLTWSGSKVVFSKKKQQDDARQMRLRRLNQEEEVRKQVEEVRHQVQLQKEMRSKHEAARQMQMKREERARQQEQSHQSAQERCQLQLRSATASTSEAALNILIVAVQATPDGFLKIGCLGQLYQKHGGLRGAIDAAGGLKGFCEEHTELTWAGNSVAWAGSRAVACKEQLPRFIQEEEEARQQAEVAQHQMQLHREMRLKQEAAQQRQMKEDEYTLQQEQAQRSAGARHQLKLESEIQLKQEAAQHTKKEDARPQLHDRSALQVQQKQDEDARQRTQITSHYRRLNREQEALQQSRLRLKDEGEARQRRQKQEEKEACQDEQLRLKDELGSVWDVFHSIFVRGIGAGLRCPCGI